MTSIRSIQSDTPPSSAAEAADYLARMEETARRDAPAWRPWQLMHWVRNIAVLAGRYSVWVPDLPGYGDSDAAASTEHSSAAEPTIAGFDTLFGTNGVIDLVGFFFGGMVAAHIAARRGLVRRLALHQLGHASGDHGLVEISNLILVILTIR